MSTLKKKKYRYIDKTVSYGKTYEYRCRSYGKYKGKKIYGPWSEKYVVEAANINASFSVSDVSYDSESQVVQFALSSAAGNGDFVFYAEDAVGADNNASEYELDGRLGLYELYGKLEQYSTDNCNWNSFSAYTLEPGQKVYFKMKVTAYDLDTEEEIEIPSDLDVLAQCFTAGTTYLGRPVYLPLNVSEKKIQTELIREMIH